MSDIYVIQSVVFLSVITVSVLIWICDVTSLGRSGITTENRLLDTVGRSRRSRPPGAGRGGSQ